MVSRQGGFHHWGLSKEETLIGDNLGRRKVKELRIREVKNLLILEPITSPGLNQVMEDESLTMTFPS